MEPAASEESRQKVDGDPSTDVSLRDKLRRFFGRFWWAVLLVGVIISVVGFFVVDGLRQRSIDAEKQQQKQQAQQNIEQKEQNPEPRMSTAQLAAANKALQHGIAIDDPANDFAIPPLGPGDAMGRQDNQKPYPLLWNDMKKVTIGADAENLYVRCDYYGALPSRMITVEGDDIKGTGCNIELVDFVTTKGTRDEGLWQVGVMYANSNGKEGTSWTNDYYATEPRLDVGGQASPTDQKDEHDETLYTTISADSTASGGAGTDYLMGAFPLADFDITPGSQVVLAISTETTSKIYHHSSIDPILDYGSAKSGRQIIYTLGSSTYTTQLPKL